jgi:hypothetical protein
VYRLFEENGILDTAEIRRRMNVRKSAGASAVDSAVVTLQKEFYITVCGNRRKTSFDGQEYRLAGQHVPARRRLGGGLA